LSASLNRTYVVDELLRRAQRNRLMVVRLIGAAEVGFTAVRFTPFAESAERPYWNLTPRLD